MKAVVLYESLTGNTEKVAIAVATELTNQGVPTKVMRADHVDLATLADADLVIVGSWVSGHFVVAQKPASAAKLWSVPYIVGKKSVVYLTYAFKAGKALSKLQTIVEARGGEVVGAHLVKRSKLPEGVQAIVASALAVART